MTSLNQNRYDQLLRRVGDLKGPGSKVNDALTELFPMIDVENVPAELLILSGARLCMANTFTAAGGATFFGHSFLRNNVRSGVIARLIYIQASMPLQTVNLGPTLNSAAANGVRAFADTRIFGEGTALVTQASNNNLTTGVQFLVIPTQTNGNFEFEPPAAISVIAPGAAFMVSNNTVNTSLRVNYIWVERVAQPSELNL